jgi:hypothetical protein
MTNYKWKDIIKQAQKCKKNVEIEYQLGMNSIWSYYFAKAIMTVNTDVKKINFTETTKPIGNNISNQIYKKDYFDMCKRLIKYVETHKQMPNYITYKNYKVLPRLATYMFSRILVYYNKNGAFPKYANINSKCFTKPTESDNEVYAYFKKVFGDFGDTIDGALSKIDGRGYGGYSDDRYSNKQSIDRMKNGQGINCTDSCHVFYNIMKQLIALGKYKKVECLHVRCSSGTGHVRLRITMNDGSKILRDPASVLDGNGIRSNWCTSNFELWAIDPSWFMENLNR